MKKTNQNTNNDNSILVHSLINTKELKGKRIIKIIFILSEQNNTYIVQTKRILIEP